MSRGFLFLKYVKLINKLERALFSRLSMKLIYYTGWDQLPESANALFALDDESMVFRKKVLSKSIFSNIIECQ